MFCFPLKSDAVQPAFYNVPVVSAIAETFQPVLGIDTTVPRTVIVFNTIFSDSDRREIEALGEFKTSFLLSRIRSHIEKNSQDLCFIANRRITVLTSKTDRDHLLSLIDEIIDIINKISKVVAVGVSSSANYGDQIGAGYKEAKNACDAAKNGKDCHILFYSTSEPVFLSRCIPLGIREDIINSVFKNCSIDEKKEFAETLKYYFEYNGKLSSAAEALFIHRNTFQYRLEKIAKLTGYDIRNTHDAFILQAVSVWLSS